MNQFVLLATMATSTAAEQLIWILFRSGIHATPLGDSGDPVVPGVAATLVVLRLTVDADLRALNRHVRNALTGVEWLSLVVLPAESVTGMTWNCRGSNKPAPRAPVAANDTSLEADSIFDEEFAGDEERWFEEGSVSGLEYAKLG